MARFASFVLLVAMTGTLVVGPSSAWAQDQFVEEDDNNDAFAAEPETADDVEDDTGDDSTGGSEPASPPEVSEPDVVEPRVRPKTPRPRARPDDATAPARTDRNKPAEPAPVATEPESPFEITKTSYEGLVERWDSYVRVLKAREVSRVRRFEGEFDQGRKNFGLHGLAARPAAPAMAAAASIMAGRAYVAGDTVRGDEMLDRAEVLAPDEPGVYLAKARLRLVHQNDGPGAIRGLWNAAHAALRNPNAKVTLATWTVTIAILGILAWMVALSIVFFARSVRMLTFDLHAALPRGAARWQVWVLVVAFAAAPILAGLGPLLVAMSWLTLSVLYVARREQALLVGIAFVTVALPFGADFAALGWTWSESKASADYTALLDVAASDARTAIAARPATSLSYVEEVALATEKKREGELEEARTRWRAIVQRRPQDATAHASLGVVAGVLGEFDLAKAEFAVAEEHGEDAASAAYNRSLVFLRQGESSKATAAAALSSSDHHLYELFRAATFTGNDAAVPHNRAFVDPALSIVPIADLIAEPPSSVGPLRREIHRVAWFGMASNTAAAAAFGVLLVWLILIVVSQRIKPSHPCRRCGTPASSRYDGPDVPRKTCSGCYNVFISKTARIEPGRKSVKEKQILNWRRGRHRTAVLLSFVWPGLGHLYAGATLLGLLFSLLYLPLLIALVISSGILPWPGYSGLDDTTVFLVGFGSIAAALVLLSAYLAHRKTE